MPSTIVSDSNPLISFVRAKRLKLFQKEPITEWSKIMGRELFLKWTIPDTVDEALEKEIITLAKGRGDLEAF